MPTLPVADGAIMQPKRKRKFKRSCPLWVAVLRIPSSPTS